MPARTDTRSTTILRYVLIAVGTAYILAYLAVAIARAGYPFDLEWIEGVLLDEAVRVLDGKGLYVSPSIAYVPQLYTPLYFYVSAAVAWLIGPSLLALRLVSFVSSLIAFALIWRTVFNETNSHFVAFMCVSLFVATYRVTGAWFDIGRNDSLLLALLLGGFYLVRFHESSQAYVAAGVLFSLAFLTKQSALFMCAPLVLYALLLNRRRGLLLAVTMAAIGGGSTLLLNMQSQGWYLYYIFDVPSHHPWIKPMLVAFWREDLLGMFPLVIACVVVYLWAGVRWRHPSAFWLVVLAGVLVGSFLTRVKEGSDHNVMLPTYAAIIVLFGLALELFLRQVQSMKESLRRPAEVLMYLLCLLQFLQFAYNPLSQLPTTADLEAGKRLLDLIAATDGEVYVPFHGYLTARVGKGAYAHSWAMEDVLKTKTRGAPILQQDIDRHLREQRFSLIIMDEPLWVMPDLERYYRLDGVVFQDDAVFFPVAGGMRNRPNLIYRPKPVP